MIRSFRKVMGHCLLPHLIPLWYLSAPFPFYVLWIPSVVHGVSYAEQKHKVTTLLHCTTTLEQALLIVAVRTRRQCVHVSPLWKLLGHKKLSPVDCCLLRESKQLPAPEYPNQCVCIWRDLCTQRYQHRRTLCCLHKGPRGKHEFRCTPWAGSCVHPGLLFSF